MIFLANQNFHFFGKIVSLMHHFFQIGFKVGVGFGSDAVTFNR